MADDSPYEILKPGLKGKVRLGSLALEMAKMNGMTEVELAKHLLQQDLLKSAGLAQRDGEA
jgi:hypothetical protein